MNECVDSARISLSLHTAVVGVDGSGESMAALEWASRAVGLDGVLYAVAAVGDRSGVSMAANGSNETAERHDLARRLEHEWTGRLRSEGHRIRCRVIEGRPADVLVGVAAEVDAELIVVGAHPKPRHRPRTIGHVTAELIRATDCPLVVVDGGESPFGKGATVVADAATGAATYSAVQWAAGFADAHGAALQLVHSRPSRPYLGPDGLLDALALYIDPEVLLRWANEELTALVDEIQRSTDHDLRIKWSSQRGRPGPHVIEASETAALIVIGRNTLPGLGRVVPRALRHVITNAPCPVVVIPPRGEGAIGAA